MALGGAALVDPMRSWVAQRDIIDGAEALGKTDAARGVALVAGTLNRIDAANALIPKGATSLAVNNVLAGLADRHLEALYLLRQRVGN